MTVDRYLAMAALCGLLPLAGASPGHAQVEAASVIVDGMSCPFCAFGVEKRLKKVAGVDRVEIDMDTGLSSMSAAPGASIDVASVPLAIRKAGFTAGRVEATAIGTVRQDSGQWVLEIDGGQQELRIETAEPALRDHLGKAAEAGSRLRVRGPVEAEAEPLPILNPTRVETAESIETGETAG